MAQSDTHQLSKVYRGTVDEVFGYRNEIPPGATLELKVFVDTPSDIPNEHGHTTTPSADKPKQLRGRGMLAGILSSEEFMRRKHEETIIEDRPIR